MIFMALTFSDTWYQMAKKPCSDSSKLSRQDRYLFCFTSRAACMWKHGFDFPSHSSFYTHVVKNSKRKYPCLEQRIAPAILPLVICYITAYSVSAEKNNKAEAEAAIQVLFNVLLEEVSLVWV